MSVLNHHEIALTLIGGPTLLIEVAGLRLLTDPTFDGPGAYQLGAITLTKTGHPVVAADAIGPIDTVLLSHDQHADNLDDAGRALLPTAKRVLTTRIGAERLGGKVEGLAPWQAVDLAPGVRVTATPARHGPVGIEPLTGDVVGFVVELDGQAIYVSGDTVWYEGVAEVARRFDVRLAILFTGAARTRGAFHVTMDGNDAIKAAHAFADARIVAVHNDGWAHFSESGEDLAQAFGVVGLGDRLVPLRHGERVLV